MCKYLQMQNIFDQKYIELYAHDITTAKRTEAEVTFLKAVIPPKTRVLDVGCGYGRHTIALAKSGFDVVGIDSSEHMISEARKNASEAGCSPTFILQDALTMSFHNEFGATVSMFSSFGYFENQRDNIKVLQNIYSALSFGGVFVLDVANKNTLLEPLLRHGENKNGTYSLSLSERLAGYNIRTTQTFDEKNNRWSIKREWTDKHGKSHNYFLSTYLYEQDELVGVCEQVGFKLKNVFGNYKSDAYLPAKSPRLILVCTKN